MDILLNVAFNLIKTGNYIPAIIILIIVIVFVIYKYTNLFRSRDLKSHTVFMTFEEFKHKLTIDCNDSNKEKVTKQFLKIYIKNIKLWLLYVCNNDWNGAEIIKKLNDYVSKIYLESSENGIPPIYTTKFKEYNESNMNMLYKYIKVADDSDFYVDDKAKKLLVLTMTQTLFFMTLNDIENICKKLNGELEKALEV